MLYENETAVFFVKGVFPGSGGGAIFYGENDAGHGISAVIDYKWKGRLPVKGEVWQVEGVKKPFSQYPKTIHVRNAIPVAPPLGKLTKRFLCEAEPFRGLGFGPSKLDKLEAGLATERISVRDALNEGLVEVMAKFLPVGMAERLVKAWHESLEDCGI
jgi:exodeoxyribonuclease V alpha subunit